MLLQYSILCALCSELIVIITSLFMYKSINNLVLAHNTLLIISIISLIICFIQETRNIERTRNIEILYFSSLIFSTASSCISNILYWTQYELIEELLIFHIITIANDIMWGLIYCETIVNNINDYFSKMYISNIGCIYYLTQIIINFVFGHQNKTGLIVNILFIIIILLLLLYNFNGNASLKTCLLGIIKIITFLTVVIATSSILNNKINEYALKSQIYIFVTVIFLVNIWVIINEINYHINNGTTRLCELIENVENMLGYKTLALILTLVSIHVVAYYDSLSEDIIYLSNELAFIIIILFFMNNIANFISHENLTFVPCVCLAFNIFPPFDIYSMIMIFMQKGINEVTIATIFINILISIVIISWLINALTYRTCICNYISTIDIKYLVWDFPIVNILVRYFNSERSKKNRKTIMLILLSIIIIALYLAVMSSSAIEKIFYVSLIITLFLWSCMLKNFAKDHGLLRILCGAFVFFALICLIISHFVFGQQFSEKKTITFNFTLIFSIFQYTIVLIGIFIGIIKILKNIKILCFWSVCLLLIIHLTLFGAFFTTDKLMVSYNIYSIFHLLELLRYFSQYLFNGEFTVFSDQEEKNTIELKERLIVNEISDEILYNKNNVINEDNNQVGNINESDQYIKHISLFVVSLVLSLTILIIDCKDNSCNNLTNPLNIMSLLPIAVIIIIIIVYSVIGIRNLYNIVRRSGELEPIRSNNNNNNNELII